MHVIQGAFELRAQKEIRFPREFYEVGLSEASHFIGQHLTDVIVDRPKDDWRITFITLEGKHVMYLPVSDNGSVYTVQYRHSKFYTLSDKPKFVGEGVSPTTDLFHYNEKQATGEIKRVKVVRSMDDQTTHWIQIIMDEWTAAVVGRVQDFAEVQTKLFEEQE